MAGAAAGFNEDFNNRQLHPTEAQLIRGNAQAYAAKRGIPVEQATTELTEQSLRQIDSAWAKRIADNPQAAAFLQQVAQSAGPANVGGGGLFDARGTSAYTDHTINASALGQTSDLYNRITDRNASGIVRDVRGAYVAYADAGTDPRLAQNTPEQIQQLLDTGRQLRQQGESVREGFAINAANLGAAQTVFTSGLARPGDGSKLADRAVGEMGEALLSGLPSEGGAVTTPTRGMRPGTRETVVDTAQLAYEAKYATASRLTATESSAAGKIIDVAPADLRWTQRTAGGGGRAEPIRQSMSENGYKGPPIDVIQMADGIVTVDHTRAVVALELGIPTIPATLHLPGDPLPASMLGRFGAARTWGEAAAYRALTQRPPLPSIGTTTPPKLPSPK
jgi:hypothetical protein